MLLAISFPTFRSTIRSSSGRDQPHSPLSTLQRKDEERLQQHLPPSRLSFFLLCYKHLFFSTSVCSTKPAGQPCFKYHPPTTSALLSLFHCSLPTHPPFSATSYPNQVKSREVSADPPGSPERCRSAECSGSLEDPPHCSPPRCHSERHREEREEEEPGWGEVKKEEIKNKESKDKKNRLGVWADVKHRCLLIPKQTLNQIFWMLLEKRKNINISFYSLVYRKDKQIGHAHMHMHMHTHSHTHTNKAIMSFCTIKTHMLWNR